MNLMLVLSIIGVAVLTLLFAWLTRRAWRAQRAWIKWPGTLPGQFADDHRSGPHLVTPGRDLSHVRTPGRGGA